MLESKISSSTQTMRDKGLQLVSTSDLVPGMLHCVQIQTCMPHASVIPQANLFFRSPRIGRQGTSNVLECLDAVLSSPTLQHGVNFGTVTPAQCR